MASSSHTSNIIQFPRLPSVSPVWDVTGDNTFLAAPLPPRAGRTLKQSKSTESLTQRKDRVEFLRRREWTRRAAAGNDQPIAQTVSYPSSLSLPPIRPHTFHSSPTRALSMSELTRGFLHRRARAPTPGRTSSPRLMLPRAPSIITRPDTPAARTRSMRQTRASRT